MSDNLRDKIRDLSKTGLANILDMPQKGKITIKVYTKVPGRPYRREGATKNINWKRFVVCFSRCNFEPKMMNSVLSGFSFSLYADNHFLTSSKQLFNLSRA